MLFCQEPGSRPKSLFFGNPIQIQPKMRSLVPPAEIDREKSSSLRRTERKDERGVAENDVSFRSYGIVGRLRFTAPISLGEGAVRRASSSRDPTLLRESDLQRRVPRRSIHPRLPAAHDDHSGSLARRRLPGKVV